MVSRNADGIAAGGLVAMLMASQQGGLAAMLMASQQGFSRNADGIAAGV